MLKQTLLLLLACFVFTTNAAIDLSGAVFDKDNKPVPGVVVSLTRAGLADTTGSDGRWQILGSTTGIHSLPQRASAQWDGKSLRLDLLAPATVQLDAYDIRGTRLGRLAQVQLEAGSHSIPVSRASASKGMSWLRLQVGGQQQILGPRGYVRLKQEIPAALARTMTDSVEQLVYTLQGQLITIDTVTKLIQAGIEKWIQEFNISGKVIPDSRVAVDTVFAWFDGGRMTGMRRGRIGFNKQNSAYSGRIYSVKSLGSDVYNYRVWLNVMANRNKRTGISDTTDFSSDFGNIDFIPEFSTGNAIPSGTITGAVTGLVNTNVLLGVQLNRKDESIAKYEWNLGDGSGFVSGKDTITGRWLVPGTYSVQARLTDIDSNMAVFTKTVNITNIGAVVAGLRDTTITPNDVVLFSMTATDTDGVAKVLWNFGDGTTDSTFAEKVHTVSHKYPGSDSVKAGATRTYPLTVTVIDKLGNATPQNAQITVQNDIPLLVVQDLVGEPDSLVTLQAKTTDRGTIAAYEWSLDGTTFQAAGKDTAIKLPSLPTLNYPVYARVTDEDGNRSKVDTIKVIVGKMIKDARDGQKYRIVTIGSQTWMAQNLNFKVDSSWWYNNSADSGAKYGRLYNWAAAMGLADSCNTKNCASQVEPQHQGVCPVGWHVPSANEWIVLMKSTGDSAKAGKLLKDVDTWLYKNYSSNQFGFSLFPGGNRNRKTGELMFYSAGWDAFVLSSTARDTMTTQLHFGVISDYINMSQVSKLIGGTLRCIQDTISVQIKDTTVELGATLALHAVARGEGGNPIVKYEWNVNGSGFVVGGPDTTITLPNVQAIKYPVYVRVRDQSGKVSAVDTASIGVFSYIIDFRDGQRYRITTIGSQTWMAQNLNYGGASNEIGLCYQNDSVNCNRFGRLYSRTDIMAGANSSSSVPSGVKGICPSGYHVPSNNEWTLLTDYVGKKALDLYSRNFWSSLGNSDDIWGFSILAGGMQSTNEKFYRLDSAAYFYSATSDPMFYGYTWVRIAYWNVSELQSNPEIGNDVTPRLSLRCVKD